MQKHKSLFSFCYDRGLLNSLGTFRNPSGNTSGTMSESFAADSIKVCQWRHTYTSN
jgi:hypothetical protein